MAKSCRLLPVKGVPFSSRLHLGKEFAEKVACVIQGQIATEIFESIVGLKNPAKQLMYSFKIRYPM